MPENPKPNRVGGIFTVVLLILAVLILMSFPMLAGPGVVRWIFGPEALRTGMGRWALWWAMGGFIAAFIVAEVAEAKIKKHLSAGKVLTEVASMGIMLLTLSACYLGLLRSWNLSVFAAAISLAASVPFYLLLSKLPAARRHD